mmetsp:Transcript_46848/g.141918  ORF Transcript_46848/g.141918 Transcript_46848/m.141918 type:complete len:94 (-) Transcript_46848:49-330(-)
MLPSKAVIYSLTRSEPGSHIGQLQGKHGRRSVQHRKQERMQSMRLRELGRQRQRRRRQCTGSLFRLTSLAFQLNATMRHEVKESKIVGLAFTA